MAESRRPTTWQRERLEDNARSHGAVFPRRNVGRWHRRVESIVFAAPNSIIDPASGAAVAANDAMQLLARAGFRCEAFGSAMLDSREEVCIEHMLAEMRVAVPRGQACRRRAAGEDAFYPKGQCPGHALP